MNLNDELVHKFDDKSARKTFYYIILYIFYDMLEQIKLCIYTYIYIY